MGGGWDEVWFGGGQESTGQEKATAIKLKDALRRVASLGEMVAFPGCARRWVVGLQSGTGLMVPVSLLHQGTTNSKMVYSI